MAIIFNFKKFIMNMVLCGMTGQLMKIGKLNLNKLQN